MVAYVTLRFVYIPGGLCKQVGTGFMLTLRFFKVVNLMIVIYLMADDSNMTVFEYGN